MPTPSYVTNENVIYNDYQHPAAVIANVGNVKYIVPYHYLDGVGQADLDNLVTTSGGTLPLSGIGVTQSYILPNGKSWYDTYRNLLVLVPLVGTTLPSRPINQTGTVSSNTFSVSDGVKVALAGDSRFFQSVQGGRDQTIWLYVLNMLIGGRINVRQHLAAGGLWLTNSLTEQFANARSDIGCFITDFGINDIILSRRTLVELKQYHGEIMNWMRARNAYWIDTTTTTCQALTPAERNVLQAFNQWRMTNNHGYSRYTCVDVAQYTSKPDLSNIRDSWHDDGLHLNVFGAWSLAYSVKDQFLKLFSTKPSELPAVQMLPNPRLANFGPGPYGQLPVGIGLDVADGAAVTSSLSYDYNPNGSWKIVVTGTTAISLAYASIGSVAVYPWTASKFVQVGNCIRPTVDNGLMYMATNEGSIAAGADPTAIWPTVQGQMFLSGGVYLTPVPLATFQTHDLNVYADIAYAETSGLGGIDFVNYGFNNSNAFQFGTDSPSLLSNPVCPIKKVQLRVGTGGIATQATTVRINPQLRIWAPAGETTTVYIDRIAATLSER